MKPAPDPDANARRFDRNFHDVDPVTGRVFSGGHPDAVWLIAIIYGLIVVGLVVSTLVTIFRPGPTNAGAVLGGVAALVLLIPPVVLLFRRHPLAVTWMIVLFVLALAGAWAAVDRMFATGFTLPLIAGVLVLVLGQGGATAYVIGMKRSDLLPGRRQVRAPERSVAAPGVPPPGRR